MHLSFSTVDVPPCDPATTCDNKLSHLVSKPRVIVIGAKPENFVDERATWVWMDSDDSFSSQTELPAAVLVVDGMPGAATQLLRDLPKNVRWNVYYDLCLSEVDRDELFHRIWFAPPTLLTIVTNDITAIGYSNIVYQTVREFVQNYHDPQQVQAVDTYFFIDKNICSLPLMQTWFAQQVPLLKKYGSYYSARFYQISVEQLNGRALLQLQKFVSADAPVYCPPHSVIYFDHVNSRTDQPSLTIEAVNSRTEQHLHAIDTGKSRTEQHLLTIEALQRQFNNLEVKMVEIHLVCVKKHCKKIYITFLSPGTSQCSASSTILCYLDKVGNKQKTYYIGPNSSIASCVRSKTDSNHR